MIDASAVADRRTRLDWALLVVPVALAVLSVVLLVAYAASYASSGQITVGEGLVIEQHARRSIIFGAIAVAAVLASRSSTTPRRGILAALNVAAVAIALAG